MAWSWGTSSKEDERRTSTMQFPIFWGEEGWLVGIYYCSWDIGDVRSAQDMIKISLFIGVPGGNL